MNGRSHVFHGYGASVRAFLPEGTGIEDLRPHVAPEIDDREDDRGPHDLLLTRWDGVYHLVIGERRYGPYRTSDDALRGVSNGIHFVLGKRSPMTFVHAGAVEIDGGAIVFPGRSRWGKSTLVASLVDQGCGYLSDEYAVVTPAGSIRPLSKPIRLRREGETFEYKVPPPLEAPDGLPCAALVLTRYESCAAWSPEPLTPGSAILGTVPAALQSRERPEQVLRAITAMVGGAACHRGARGDGEPTVDALRRLLSARSLIGV